MPRRTGPRRSAALALPLVGFLAVVTAGSVFVAGPARAQSTFTYPHVDPDTKADDPGTPTANPDGSTTTTYKDGWTKTTRPEDSYEKGGSREIFKDPRGRIREIFRKDKAGRTRHHLVVVEDPKTGAKSIYTENYNARGELIDATREDETPDGKTKKYTWDPEKNDYVALGLGIPESIQRMADAVSAQALPLATALTAIGVIAMAFIQTAKDAFPIRRWFQERWVRRWLARQRSAAPGQTPPPDAPAPPEWTTAEEDLIRLATGGDRKALYDLPIEQLCAQMNAAAGVVLDYPWRHEPLLRCLAAGANPDDLGVLLGARPWAEKPRSEQSEADRRALANVVDPRNRVGHQVQRNIDALQIAAGFRWKLLLQITSIVLCGVLVVLGLWRFGASATWSHVPLYILTAVLAGFLAPVARDLVAALQQLRK